MVGDSPLHRRSLTQFFASVTKPASDAVVCECVAGFASSLEASQVLRLWRGGISQALFRLSLPRPRDFVEP